MRFEFYHPTLSKVNKLSVDGTVDDNSIHLSHWEGNKTPPELRADTSTEIALNFVASPQRDTFARGVELVTNNHFDTDGVLSIWTVLTGEKSLALTDKLIAAAEAGDFSEYRNADAVRASIVIQGADQASANNETVSPLARQLSGLDVIDDARSYELVLPEVEKVLTHTDDYEQLWRDAWSDVERALESFASGRSTVVEDSGVSLVTLAPDIFSSSGFNPTRHAAPFTAISANACGQIFVIVAPADDGWYYRIDYPYYSWAETIVRPRIERRDLTVALSQLNEREPNREARWQIDLSEMTSAAKFLHLDKLPASSKLAPDLVAGIIRSEFTGAKSTASGAD